MPRAADAVVTGFCKSRALAEISLAPLRQLQQESLIRRIVCVTWDGADVDEYARWITEMDGVVLSRVPQPHASGTGNQRGIVYQTETLRAALALLPDDGALTIKSRPDYVFDEDFLRRKIAAFDDWSAIPPRTIFGAAMPKPALQRRIWVPWADSNQPFYYEDAAFIGTRRDIARLVTKLSEQDMALLGDEACGSFVHAVRYARIFAADYPIFARYLKEYRYFASDVEYRRKLLPHALNDGFFWHLLVANAWVLHSHFHVDAGRPGDLRFYSNTLNRGADWSRIETLRLANPYNDIEGWRTGTRPGEVYPSLYRAYGRLVDDAWQRAIFAGTVSDVPRAMLVRIAGNIAGARDGRLKDIENTFYRGLAQFHALHRAPLAKAG